MNAVAAALRGPLPAEVETSGTVLDRPVFFRGTRTGARHEEFHLRTDDGVRLRVDDNVDLAPPVPLRPGDRVALRGQLELDPDGPMIHYTHRSTNPRHEDGWIETGGRRYA